MDIGLPCDLLLWALSLNPLRYVRMAGLTNGRFPDRRPRPQAGPHPLKNTVSKSRPPIYVQNLDSRARRQTPESTAKLLFAVNVSRSG